MITKIKKLLEEISIKRNKISFNDTKFINRQLELTHTQLKDMNEALDFMVKFESDKKVGVK